MFQITPQMRVLVAIEPVSHGRPIMTGLKTWIDEQFEQRKVEPNSPLGGKLSDVNFNSHVATIRIPYPARVDSLKATLHALGSLAVRNRKNALFYRTLNGAQIGDLFMSLIHTCELNGVNPFGNLNHLQSLPTEELQNNAGNLLPWNYQLQAAAPS